MSGYKNFAVSVDFTMSKMIEVKALDENDARRKVEDMIRENPYGYARDFSHYVRHDVIDAEEVCDM